MTIQKIRNNALGAFKNKKGFTLVEVIVVLVILAILAAILVPRLTGWIDQAKDKAATGEGHLVLTALQSYATAEYSEGGFTAVSGVPNSDLLTETNKYLTGDITLTATNLTSVTITADGAVVGFEYTASNGKTIVYSVPTTGTGTNLKYETKGTFTTK